MSKENKILIDRTRLSNIMAVAYVLNRSFCINPDRYLKLEEIMEEVSEHLTIDLNLPNDILNQDHDQKRQFRRYIAAVSSSIANVESTSGTNGGYKLSKDVPTLNMFDEEECTMLSLTLPKSDLVARLKKHPDLGKRLNVDLIKANNKINQDVLYGLMDAEEAIRERKKIYLIGYCDVKGKIHDNIKVTPCAIRWFKGVYYEVCVFGKLGNQHYVYYRFERAISHDLDNESAIPYDEEKVNSFVDETVFGIHRDQPKKLYTLKIEQGFEKQVEEALDHKITIVKKNDHAGYSSYVMWAYGINEVSTYISELLSKKIVEFVD